MPQSKITHPGVALAIIIASYMLILLDTSIVITGIPRIQQDIGLSVTELSWVQSIYTLFFGGFLLLGARAGDSLGARRALEIGLVIFMATSLAIACAQSPTWLLLARAGQGIGAAFVGPSALTLLSTNFEEGEARQRAVAWYGSTAGIGASLGLVIGGWLADAISWRAGFLLNLPVGLMLILASRRYLGDSGHTPGRFDFLGAILSTLGIGSIIFGVTHASDVGWASMQTIAALLAGFVLVALFVGYQARVSQPLMPLHLFASRRRVGAYIARFLFLGPMVGFFFFSSQFMQGVMGFTALEAGFGFMPMTIFAFAISLVIPRLMRVVSDTTLMVSGLVTILVGDVWMSFLHAGSGYWLSMAVPMVLVGAGQGLCLAPMTSIGISGTRPEEAGAASGILNVAHQVGASFGLGLLASIAAMFEQGTGPQAIVEATRAAFTAGSVMLGIAVVVGGLLVRRPSANQTNDQAMVTSRS